MHFSHLFAALTSLTYASPAPNPHTLSPRSTSYHDTETGFTFSETKAAATLTSNIVYRIAQPANVPANTPYDIVLQVVAPISLGWVGLAWGGGMIRNPLTVGYPNGNKASTVSSRWATSHSTPSAYPSATLTSLRTGNKSNSTHYQYTVQCSGCTSYTSASGAVVIDPTGSRRFGFACSQSKVSNPGSATASIPVHDVYGYITHDFAAGANSGWDALLARNGGRNMTV
ncbi:hypothetical protein PtrSN002B_004948 [Pyrenophora tritici-repentis]|uniref:Atrophin-1 multi-domain protein n=1 Tax=Pyrenophora tritici-repentis TaxID=45151 RepID=A0A2W1EB18_9PLEO|nr:CDH-cyt domain-containing protein [Pyrenophora tritici-repentis]KAF7444703.1 CDH-cyt domain containing protein [Pyrenophora tritici-repentis]KAF7564636.1 Atrophin-1 multi-domain protein [Pyrenophora tritici-repentis]KAG9378943.1 CDH-cyt domain containing protein [Pyrenophora tritici-repentis]KAI0589296.1 CDH-cyt domain-containing protein [Pyrenophora tritici-repentis]